MVVTIQRARIQVTADLHRIMDRQRARYFGDPGMTQVVEAGVLMPARRQPLSKAWIGVSIAIGKIGPNAGRSRPPPSIDHTFLRLTMHLSSGRFEAPANQRNPSQTPDRSSRQGIHRPTHR